MGRRERNVDSGGINFETMFLGAGKFSTGAFPAFILVASDK
jgi:hypothetical protein